MRNSMIVYFPKNERLITQDGYVLKVQGEDIEQEFAEMGRSRTTDDYNIDVELFPREEGIYIWEGELDDANHEFDTRQFIGKWRPAAADDLFRAGLIK